VKRSSRPALSAERQEARTSVKKEAKSRITEQQEVVASLVDGGYDGMDPSDTLAIRSVASVRKSDLEKILASLTAATSTGGAEKGNIGSSDEKDV
jgi:hypothetical protein